MLPAHPFVGESAKSKKSTFFRPRLENLEDRIVPSFADGNGAIITNLTAQNGGSQMVISFDGPLTAAPGNPAQSPNNVANYAVEIPSANPKLVTSNASAISINSATYDNNNFQVTLDLASPLTQGTFYRVFVNGIPSADNTATPGLIDGNNRPIDGDYDDTASGNFYALFAWTTSTTALQFTDSGNDQISLTLAGPGQLQGWRALNGDFNALNLAAQANAPANSVQQLSVIGGVLGQTTLTGAAVFAPGNTVVVVPPIAGQGSSFTNNLPAYFKLIPAPPPTPPGPIAATPNNLPYTLQIQQVNSALPPLQAAVAAQDNVAGSPYLGYWLLFGGRTDGLHTFTGNDNFKPQDQNLNIFVINPANFQVWTKSWSTSNVSAAVSQSLYSTEQQFFQQGDNLFTVGGYGVPYLGGGTFGTYTTYDTLSALSVNGLINAVITSGDVAGLSRVQQIHDSRLQVTGGAMQMLGTQAYLFGGQDYQGQYLSPSAVQTYIQEIRSFQISYNGQTPGSLAISNYQAHNDQVSFHRRDFNLENIIQPNLQPALQLLGGVFTPGPVSYPAAGQAYRSPIALNGSGQAQISSYQQFFSQYNAPHVGLFDSTTGSMYTILFGGKSLYDYNFANGQLTSDKSLPFVRDVTTYRQSANGVSQEFEMPSQLPGLYGVEAQFFTNSQAPQYANGVFQLGQFIPPITLGYMYGGILSSAQKITDPTTQTMATGALFKFVLVPAPTVTLSSAGPNPTSRISVTATFSQPVQGLTAAEITTTNATATNLQPLNPVSGFATTWTFILSPTNGPGTVTAKLQAGVAANSAGSNNTASNTFTTTYKPAAQTVGVFDPSSGAWYLRNSNSSGGADVTPFAFGAPNWYPITGDWDGNGITTIGVVDLTTETWYLRNFNSSGPASIAPFQYGAPGWIPVVGDWTGSGHTGIGLYDPNTAHWYLRNEDSAGAPDAGSFAYGAPGWLPVAGDWNGVGHTGIGVFDPGKANWYLRTDLSAGGPNANPGGVAFSFGGPGWIPVVGDWAGQGKSTIGVVSPGTETWYLRNSNSPGSPSFNPFNYGAPGWKAAVGDWDYPKLPQLAVPGKAPSSILASAPLTNGQLHTAVKGALARLRAEGVAANVLTALSSIRFVVGTLSHNELGISNVSTGQVVIDASAGGNGWFVDQTPLKDQEFTNANGTQIAKNGSAAAGHMDLLTVLLHEMGHFEGWTELDPTQHPDALMALTLATGMRRTTNLEKVFEGGWLN